MSKGNCRETYGERIYDALTEDFLPLKEGILRFLG